jgi:putative endonuclease
MYYVYIIYSDRVGKKYIGQTMDLAIRLGQHNSKSYGGFTMGKGPWRMIHSEIFETRYAALQREKWLKSGVGRDWIKERFSI